jgi:hypothetical protein
MARRIEADVVSILRSRSGRARRIEADVVSNLRSRSGRARRIELNENPGGVHLVFMLCPEGGYLRCVD